MGYYWNNIKKIVRNQDNIKFLILFLFLVICIVLFIVIQQQDDTINNLVNDIKEKFEDNNLNAIKIKVDDIDITNYNENNKLKLLDGNSEFEFILENLKGKFVSMINFINISGDYQNIELLFTETNIEILEFSQFLNLDTAYKMIVYYSDNNSNKTVSHTFYTSTELNYKIPIGVGLDNNITNLNVKLNAGATPFQDLNNILKMNMKQFNYITFNIIKPNLNKLRVKLLETDFENDKARNKYLTKLQIFDKLVPLKFTANLSLIKDIGDPTSPQYITYSELDLREHRRKYPLTERIILPNPNCNNNNCELQIRNVVKDQLYSLKIRLEYYYLDNIRNIRATPYLEIKVKVVDDDNNSSFSISKLNIIGNLEEDNKLKTIFEDTQKEQDAYLDKIENNFKKLLD